MTELVGILNVTPDSFSDGGEFLDPAAAVAQADELFRSGAALVDVGAESTRPNALPLSDNEEWARLEPVLSVLIPRYPGQISLDSFHPATIDRAFGIGEVIVNDVTGMHDPLMVETVLKHQARCIISHLAPGMDIQTAHKLEPTASVEQVKFELLDRARLLERRGLDPAKIILDPGIGFGKRRELNPQLLRFAELVPDRTVMIGYSRKRFLGEHRLELAPNLAAGRIAIASGARYLRVHDVAGHMQLLR
ncbi:MAG TPA: dihydropteroate synthase [Candidatus Saccharimonadales bacterium]|nr:dihydropteroate synthase [Candidatus Saccharimonadales bacterium]